MGFLFVIQEHTGVFDRFPYLYIHCEHCPFIIPVKSYQLHWASFSSSSICTAFVLGYNDHEYDGLNSSKSIALFQFLNYSK